MITYDRDQEINTITGKINRMTPAGAPASWEFPV
jgi:hypothetical protein